MAGVTSFIKINQRDLKQLNRKLDYLKNYDKKEFSKELAYTASQIARTAKTNVVRDTGKLGQKINYEAKNKVVSVFAKASYAPYVEFGTGGLVDLTDMQQLGIPDSYAAQFKGSGQKRVNLPARPFFFNAVRIEFRKMLDRINNKINKGLK